MPLLAGIFSRKNKAAKRDVQAESITSTELDSALSSPSVDYVMPDKPLPSYPNAAGLLHPTYSPKTQQNRLNPSMVASVPSSSSTSSTSKLRLPFTRKKSHVAVSPSSQSVNTSPPRPSYFGRGSTSTAPDEDSSSFRLLRPPPSRSAMFAAYNDSDGSLSTRSLPNESTLPMPSPTSSTPRRPSFFHWGKSDNSAPRPSRLAAPPTSSHLSPPARELPPLLPSDSKESFNLKSFRHVIPPSPARSNNGSNVSLNTPPPRPRGASVNSDSSQRISVAAFREAQAARRSLAGSPVPSPRSPSPGPSSLPQASPLGGDLQPGRNTPRSSRSSPHIARPRSSIAQDYASESDESSSGAEDSEDETLRARPNASTRPGKARAKSELGHGHSHTVRQHLPPMPHRAPQSHLGHSSFSPPAAANPTTHNPSPHASKSAPPEANQTGLPPRAQSSLGHNHPTRQRASVSASAVTPSGDARRASMVANAPPLPVNVPRRDDNNSPRLPPPVSMSVEERTKLNTAYNRSMTNVARTSKGLSSSSSDSDSEDDAPLARLVGPRRPGSALSSHSNAGSRSGASGHHRPTPPKPLIDINQLTNSKPQVGPPKNMDAFTPGSTLLSDSKLVSSPRSPLSEPPLMTKKASSSSSTFVPPLVSTVPPIKFVSPPSSPIRESRSLLEPIQKVESRQPSPTADVVPPESRRAALNDRLTRAVKRSLSPGDRVSTDAAAAIAKSPLSLPAELPPVVPLDDVVPPPLSSPLPASDKGAPPATRTTTSSGPLKPPNRLSSGMTVDPSPPDQDLAQLMGAAAKFISMNGESPSDDSSSSESDSSDSEESIKEASAGVSGSQGIAPIPIKKRAPPPAFAVTSRPPFAKRDNTAPPTSIASSSTTTESVKSSSSTTPRQRSSTLVPSSTSSSLFGPSKSATPTLTSTTPNLNRAPPSSFNSPTPGASSDAMSSKRSETSSSNPPAVRQRSSTMVTNSSSTSPPVVQTKLFPTAPDRPFIAARRDSPASSTGDSSSGRAPLTPRDGSDIGGNDGRKREEWSSGVSGLGVKNNHAKRRSVSFEDDIPEPKGPGSAIRNRDLARSKETGKGSSSSIVNVNSKTSPDDVEYRRRERRRSEAKAAIELGNVINGPGPVLTDDDETDLPANPALNNPRMSTMNMGGMGGMPMGFPGAPGVNPWMNPAAMQTPPMLPPGQFMMPPPNADPQFMAAHQHAMMIAKQAYQMAVAQQAMAAAADEWERGSAMGGFGGGSVYGGSTVGGPTMASPFGMPMGMMQPGGGWGATSSVYLGGSSRSMYGGMMNGADMMSSSRSDYGGFSGAGGGGNNWSSSRSSYGDSFGPSNDRQTRKGPGVGPRRPAQSSAGRESGYFPAPPPIPASQFQNGRSSPDMRGSTPRSRTTSQPAISANRQQANARNAPPPSSWKAGM